jgi:SAM-dependent methyltransferase
MSTEIKEAVRQRYADAANTSGSCCGGSGCCSDADPITRDLYDELQRQDVPVAALEASLGCGNPTALAELAEGETVLDLGSGGGIDVILSARRVGSTGRAIGVDMTEEMLALARRNAADARVPNVEFRKGEIEALPLEDGEVDVVISNCVINLSVDKPKVLAEAFRVLKPGGRLGFTDWVITGKVDDELLGKLYESMAFPYMESFEGWQAVLKKAGFKVLDAQDQTEDYARCFDDYKKMVEVDLKPTIVKNFGEDLFGFATGLVNLWRDAAHAHQVGRGFYIAEKPA